MFHSYYANSLEQLAQRFSHQLDSTPENPLEPVWVIVQNNEIKEWLSLKVAEEKGISGNFKFIFPSEFLWMLYRLVEDDVPKVLPSDLNSMQWTLFELFGQKSELLKHIPFFDETEVNQRKRFQLCGQLANIFDQYQVYRPEMVGDWLDGKLISKNEHEKWQAAIWKKLNERWRSNPNTKDIPSRAGAFSELLSWLDTDSSFLHQLPKQLYVFGLSQASKPFLEITSRLANDIDVHYYKRDQAVDFGVDLEPIQELMTDWMKPASEQNQLLLQLLTIEGTPNDIIQLETESDKALPVFSVHSCHSKRREVQVLKDEVLQYLDHHPDCDVSRVLIMVPDAEEYTSLIETIFEHAEGEPSLPVSRLSNQQWQSQEYALNRLFDILSSSYKTSEFFELVNLEPVKQKFSFTDEELDTLEGWILDNKIFRGLGNQPNSAYSWQKALNQMVSGFAMEPDSLTVFNGLVPYQKIASGQDMQLVARFSECIQSLIRAEDEVQQPKTADEWLDFTAQLVKDFLDHPGQESASGVYKMISKLKEQAAYAKLKEQLAYQTIKNWLKAQFDTTSSTSGRFGQGITVSSYVPYRSVPFRFIGVLGMNEGVFPRKAVRPEFDLIYANPQPGDRIQKEDDTYLFLETMFAAQDHLHISYKGRDQRTNTNRLPSILVQQYLDKWHEDWQAGIIYHNLHPFNTNYFKNEEGRFSYSNLNLNLAKKLLENGEESKQEFIGKTFNKVKPFESERLHISDIISFFTHPSKYILYNKLGLSNYSNFNEITDREPFKLSNLDRYYLNDFLFQKFSNREPVSKFYEFAHAAAMIPDELEGEKSFIHEKEKVRDLLEVIEKHTSGEKREVEIEIQYSDIELYGTIPGVYDDVLISYRVGSRRAKHEVSHWLKHLLLLENGTDIKQSFYISKNNEGVQVLGILSADIPENLLSILIEWYFGQDSILHKTAFFPETSRAYAKEFKKKGDSDSALDKATKTWEYDKRYNNYAESNDYFNALMWRNLDPISHEAFTKNAITFWDAFLEVAKEEE